MSKTLFSILLCLFLSSIHVFSQQAEQPVQVRLLLEGGLEYGGEEILTVFFTNGEDQIVRAGQGGYVAIGGQLSFPGLSSLMFRSTIGIKYNTTAAENANIRLTRLPFHFTPFWKINEDFRLGVGITTHQEVRFRGDGFVPNIDFTSSLGPRFEFGYKALALTYTALNYISETNEQVSASSVGLSVSYLIPNR